MFWRRHLAPVWAALVIAAPVVGQVDLIVDNDVTAPTFNAPPYQETGTWTTSTSTGYNGGLYRFSLHTDPLSTATWTPNLPEAGWYEVSTIYLRSSNRAASAPWTINHANGTTVVNVDMSGPSIVMAELLLGEFEFNAGTAGTVTLTNNGSSGAYIADALRFRTSVDDPPTIDTVTHSPSHALDTDAVTVTARVLDDRGIASVTVDYSSSPGGTSGSVTAHDDGNHGDGAAGDGIFGAQIPPHAIGEEVTFTFTATDNGSNQVTSAPVSYTVQAEPPRQYRALWADTWNASILNASQVQDIVNTARTHNINTLVVEVRKIGDAYYNSNLEPRATNISGGSSFDPLGYLIELAHDTSGGKRRIDVHAWFVMHRIWTGSGSKPAGHVLVQHPEYRMLDSNGNMTAGTTEYLDPGHPGTVEHNIAVILDCMANYNIDGVNLDYIRYPEYTGSWGYNATSIARFNAFTGKSGQPATNDPDWAAWRRECVTLEVKKLYVQMMKLRPSVVLTADTVNWGFNWDNFTASSAYAGVYQDWVGWLQEGILDYNMLMNYSNQVTYPTRYQGWTNLSLASDDIRGSIIGIGAYLQPDISYSMWQLQYALDQGADGVAIYDWGSEVNASTSGETRNQFYNALSSQLFTQWADPPVPEWKTNPTRGIFEGIVTDGGVPVDHATVRIEGQPQTTTHSDGVGWYGILEVPPGSYTLRASAPGRTDRLVPATINAGGDVITVNIDFAVTAFEGWLLLEH